MRRTSILDSTSRWRRAGEKASGTIRRVAGGEDALDLAIYERLQPEDFEVIRQNFGDDGLQAYMRDMNKKKGVS